MNTPVFEIQFDIDAAQVFPAREHQVAAKLNTGEVRNVIVLAHGWNNDREEARTLFTNFLIAAESVDSPALANAIAIEVYWPSKKFAPQNQIPGGAAAFPTPDRILNLSTYYVMKDRSAKIGTEGLNPFLARLQAQSPVNIRYHLIGHSFGARLVTAAADAPNRLRVDSLILLQAAYSQNGLATNFDGKGANGYFCKILTEQKIDGPILITHTRNDKAVGLAYPLASRLNGCDSAHFGDANDLFGGMGANGAQHVEAIELRLQSQGPYKFEKGKIYNLNGDAIIASHGDVARPETAALLTSLL
ncbi:MAG: alpha/beta hydrolase [Acidobacteriota bacterium]|nr:alpha/beta hydrolase [Acidobacteriota bacterium]